jgi:hypothetical protein
LSPSIECSPSIIERVSEEHINLVCREFCVEIPGVAERSPYAGGTYEWCKYLNSKGALSRFVEGEILLLRRYFSESDQGHIAILCVKYMQHTQVYV